MARAVKCPPDLPTIEGYGAKIGQQMMGDEGPAYRATIFLNGVKVGEAHEAGEGGPMRIWFDDPAQEKAFNDVANRVYTEFDFERDSGFVSMLLDLADRVKSIRKWLAQGYTGFVMAHKWSDYVGDRFVPGGEANLMGFGGPGSQYDRATPEQRADVLTKQLRKKGYDAARWVNADGTFGEWLYKPAPGETKERPFSLTEG